MAYQPFDLTGKVALITGGNSGIGLGMAEALAAAGAGVAIWGTNVDKNKAALGKLEAHGTRSLACAATWPTRRRWTGFAEPSRRWPRDACSSKPA